MRRCALLHCDTGGEWRVLSVAYGFNLITYRLVVLMVAWIAKSVEWLGLRLDKRRIEARFLAVAVELFLPQKFRPTMGPV